MSFVAQQAGQPLTGGTWSVTTADGGTVSSSGVYTAPASLSQSGSATVQYTLSGNQAQAAVTLLNPVPSLTAVTPSTINSGAPVTLNGSGFMPSSAVLVNGKAVATTYVNASTLSVLVSVPAGASTVALQVSNPAPGSASSQVVYEPVSTATITVTPAQLSGGNVTVTVSAASVPGDSVVKMDGVALTTTSLTATTVTATGYLAPWKTGGVGISMANSTGETAPIYVPIAATAVPYDTASRFAMQAAFGPRPDIIQHIQQVGLEPFLDEQMAMSTDGYYSTGQAGRTNFLRNLQWTNALLRPRIAWAFQSFIPQASDDAQISGVPYEEELEDHAFGSFKQILLDAASTYATASLLNLPNNFASSDPSVHPNQNFARELLQVYSVGAVLLNEDGTPLLDANGNTQPTYGQDTILALSRALTGWAPGPVINSAYTSYGVDFSSPLVAVAGMHDEGSKTLFGNVVLPSGQTAAQDRDQALEAIFQHPNLPPFVSRLLIQRLVKSQPSPAYVSRVVQVFKNDGNGVRGNLAAVIKAILLDPEARAGDVAGGASPTDGAVQDPLMAMIIAMDLYQLQNIDDQPTYDPGRLGEDWWYATSAFAYFSPAYVIPGTTLNSPEFQLLNNITMVQRSQFLYGIVMETQGGFTDSTAHSIFTNFPDLDSMVDALDHILYHGGMPQATKDTIVQYCSTLPDTDTQLKTAIFLALNSDSATVIQ